MSRNDREQKQIDRQGYQTRMYEEIRRQGRRVNLREIIAYKADLYYKKHHPDLAKWQNARDAQPRQVDVNVYGCPIPLNFGTFRHKCNIIWTTGIQPDALSDSDVVNTGAGNADVAFVERFKASWAVVVCEGPQGALLRVWMNKILVYDHTTASSTGYAAHPNFANKIVFYPGNETQTADPTIEAEEGVGNVPGYRGTCYLVFKDIPLNGFNKEIPEVEAEVSAVATPDYRTYNVEGFPVVT